MLDDNERDLLHRVNAAMLVLDDVNPEHSQVLRLHDVEGLPRHEVAITLGLPEETVRGRVLLGRQFVHALVFPQTE